MLRKVHRIDSNCLYVEDVILQDNDPVPSDCVEVPMPEGIFLPAKFANGQWSTVATQDQINALMNPVVPPSDIDDLKKQMADLSYTLMMNGVI